MKKDIKRMNMQELIEVVLYNYAYVLDNSSGFDKENDEFAEFYNRYLELLDTTEESFIIDDECVVCCKPTEHGDFLCESCVVSSCGDKG